MAGAGGGADVFDLRPRVAVPEPRIAKEGAESVTADEERSLPALVIGKRMTKACARPNVLALRPKQ